MSHGLDWILSALTIALILIRPWKISEAVWASAGAVALLLTRAVSPPNALAAIGRGTDVYIFLTGMMLLAELARREGFFDWIAFVAVRKAGGSPTRLFAIVYGVGVVVTIFLSNDATAVVLTPAVLAVVKKAKATALPYLLCLRVHRQRGQLRPTNLESGQPGDLRFPSAASADLVANLCCFLPLFPSCVTYALLRLLTRKDLTGEMEPGIANASKLSPAGRRSAYGIAGTSVVLLTASFFKLRSRTAHVSLPLPWPRCFVAVIDRKAPLGILKEVSWSVIPLVAALFVLVEAMDHAGALALTGSALKWCAALPKLPGMFAAAFGVCHSFQRNEQLARRTDRQQRNPPRRYARHTGFTSYRCGSRPQSLRDRLPSHHFVAGRSPPWRRGDHPMEVPAIWRSVDAGRPGRRGCRAGLSCEVNLVSNARVVIGILGGSLADAILLPRSIQTQLKR